MTDLQCLIRQAQQQRWSVEVRRGGHLCWRAPCGGAQVFSASSPSDWRNLANLKSCLRRHGLTINDGGKRHDT